MKLLTDINTVKHKDMVEFICDYCSKIIKRKKKNLPFIKYPNLNPETCYAFCDIKCQHLHLSTALKVECKQCQKTFLKALSATLAHPNHFCSSSCAATYNNLHKSYGYHRSKLEIYLEEEIKIKYPNLPIECNNKSVINSELDFYFPSLKFAIELNGIFHYEPIYGQDKFDKIINNDKQKFKLCLEHGIELCILDVSKISYLKKEIKKQYSQIIFNILDSIINRNTVSSIN